MRSNFRKIGIIIYLGISFFIIIGIWYSPVLLKGYPAEPMSSEIVLARNFAGSGVYGLEDDLNIVIAPELVKSRAHPSSLGNKVGPLSYALIFKAFGWQDWNRLILISAIIYALGAIIFTVVVYYLFGLTAAIIFPFIYALLPFNWHTAGLVGIYEFAIFYFSLFTLFYFWGRDRKFNLLYLILAGVFLGLAGLAREALFLFLPIFFFWLLFNKKKKELLAVFVPLGFLLLTFWLISAVSLKSSNDYFKLFIADKKNESEFSDFHFYGHIYPDPYTFHFDKESVEDQLAKDIERNDNGLLYRVGRLKVGANMGLRSVSFFERLIIGTTNLGRHLSKYFAIEYIGGPLIFILMLVGFWQLKRINREIYYLFLAWLISVPLILSYVVLAIRSHLMDFGFAITSLVALGLISLLPLLKDYFQLGKTAKIFYFFIILIVLYNLVLANHVYWGRAYDNTSNLEIKYLAEKINKFSSPISAEEIIAVGDRNLHPTLNYLTGKSIVFFHPNTISKLIEEDKLQQAFDKFGVKYIVGYSPETSVNISKNSAVKNIADWPAKIDIEPETSYNKMWLLNLIK